MNIEGRWPIEYWDTNTAESGPIADLLTLLIVRAGVDIVTAKWYVAGFTLDEGLGMGVVHVTIHYIDSSTSSKFPDYNSSRFHI